MNEPTELPNLSEWRVQNSEQAVKLVRAQLERVGTRHAKAFIPIPSPSPETARNQRKEYTLLMMEYGICIGLIEMAHKSGLIEAGAYESLRREAHSLTMPGVVGVIGG
jgi:hypothetical protein